MSARPHTASRAAALLAGVVALTACVDRGPAPRAQAPPPSFAHAEHPPFELTLEGAADAGETTLTARVALHDPLPAPLELTLTLPDGATLAAGAASERVVAPTRGRVLTRSYRLRGAAGRPIALTARQLAGDVAGAHATRTWPPTPAGSHTDGAPRWAPSPAARHGAVPIGDAVALPAPGAP